MAIAPLPYQLFFHLFHKNNLYAFFSLGLVVSFTLAKWTFKWENYTQKMLYQVFTSTENNAEKA